MKKTLSFIMILLWGNIFSQLNWQKGGNTNTPPGSQPIIGTDATWNSPLIFHTNGIPRMLIFNGGVGLSDGRIAMGENLPTGFIPQARLHIHHQLFTLGTSDPFIRFTTALTGNTNTDGFTIGNSTSAFPTTNLGQVDLTQFETAPIIVKLPNFNPSYTGAQPYEWMRIQNGQTFLAAPTAPSRVTDGYIGLNVGAPRANIEMITPAFQGGEEFFMAKPGDIFDPPSSTTTATNVQMGMMNITSTDKQFQPAVFGNVNQQFQSSSALVMVGAIHNAQDIPANPPVMRFVVGRDWLINGNTASSVGGTIPTNSVVVRPIFSWENGGGRYMYMSSNGRLRIGENLSTSSPVPPYGHPNNRIEIMAAPIDPYFNNNGNPIGNPNLNNLNFGSASGLRFTFLTSRDLVIAPNATNEIDPSKVLSVDVNGDVVAIYPSIGALCSNTAQVAAQAFTGNRTFNQNTFNMEWRNGRSGFGTSNCTVGNRVEITGLTAFNSTPGGNSGLRFSLLTSATSAITNPTNKVLSVNSNGDVILVQDQTGTSTTGPIVAQNGLTLIGTNTVEWGGTLLHATKIDFAGNDLSYYNTLSSLQHRRSPTGGTFDYALGPNNQTGQASYEYSVTATGNINSTGRFLFMQPSTSAVSPSGLFGDGVTVTGAAVSGGTITGNTYGYFAKTTNEGSSNGSNYAVTAWALGASIINTNAENVGYAASVERGSKNYGVLVDVPNSTFINSKEDYGFFGDVASNANTNISKGGHFQAVGAKESYGVYAIGSSGSVASYGVFGFASNSSATIPTYALFGKAGANTISYAGYFNGDVVRTGSDNFTSDQNLKQNIDTISNALGIIKQLKPKTFDYKISSFPSMSLPSGKQYGLIAQDVQPILPELVNQISHPAEQDSAGNIITPAFNYKSLEYQQLIPIMIRAMQQQDQRIEKQDSLISVLQNQINNLTSSVTACCSNSNVRLTTQAEQNQLSVNLSDKDVIVLNQNVPNPFAEQTTITYNVPESYGYAQIIFTTVEGRILKTVDITKKGRGQINVYSNDLSSGMYMYSLVVDGKTFDTKKMVKGDQ